jgi:hypothetical protein
MMMMIMSVKHSVKRELGGETKVLGENCNDATLPTAKSHLGSNPSRRGGKPEL